MDKLSEFRIFVSIIERGDFSAAARSLDLTPSAVSKSVKRLEARLGTRLLDRTSRTMRTTEDGDTFYAAARRAIDAVIEAEESVSGSMSMPEGDLRIQAPPTFAIYQLARVMPEFQENYPAIRVAFIINNEPLDMAEHRIDAVIRVGLPPDTDLIARKIATSSWVTCASPIYLARRGYPKDVEDLVNHDCLGYALTTARTTRSRTDGLESAGPLLTGSPFAANNGSMLQALARMNVGIVRLAKYHVAADLAAGRLVRVFPDEPEPIEDVFATYPRKLRGNSRLSAFVDYLRAKFSDPDWRERSLTPTRTERSVAK